MLPVAIFVGAGIGGLARYAIGGWAQAAAGAGFPWGTLLVNVTGSLLLTFLYTLLEGTAAPPEWRAFLGIGICGGYTTFSTFSYETLTLIRTDRVPSALVYVAASMVLGIAAGAVGYCLGRLTAK